jgi:hypothetical protein
MLKKSQMSQESNGFEVKVSPLLSKGEHPLLCERIALCAQLGEIMLDMDRYNSQEWFDVVEGIRNVTRRIREEGVDTSRFHDSAQFPMRHNPAAMAIRDAIPNTPISDTPPPVEHIGPAEAA